MNSKIENDKNDKLAYFNILKFIGAFLIAIPFHYADHFIKNLNIDNPFTENPILWHFSTDSYVFVEMYFIISGILFVIAYKNKILEGASFDNFYIKRVIRIFPLLIITTLVVYLLNFILLKVNGIFWSCGSIGIVDLFVNLIFGGTVIFNIPNFLNGPIWYINVLMLCYVVAFILTKLSKKCKTNFVFVIPIIVGLMILYSNTNEVLFNYSTARGFVAFFVGVMLAMLFQYIDLISKKGKIIYRCILLLICISLLYFYKTDSYGFGNSMILFFSLLMFPAVILFLYDFKLVNRICQTKFVKYLGNISFGIYLWNFPIYILLHLLIVNKILVIDVTSIWFFILIIVLHMVIATISYYLIDKKLCTRLMEFYKKIQKLKLS